jgi:AraC-like DNA-binding protein
MLGEEHLALRLIRLRAPEEWTPGAGLAFVFPQGGAGSYHWGRLAQRLGPGDIAVASGEPAGKLCVAEGEEMVFWTFSLCVEHLFPLFASDEISLLSTLMEGLKGIKLHPAAGALAAQCHRLIEELPPQFNLDHRSQLLRVATTILTEEFKTARRQRVGYVQAEEHLVQAFEKLSTEQLLHLSVGELAEQFGCSRRHLNRLFHKHFGFSIVGLRMEMRLLKAISLLRDPGAKVIHVAEQSGFNHLGLFNTCFRRRFGTSPGQWRKQATQGQQPTTELVAASAHCPMHSNGMCPWLCQTHPPQSTPAQPGTTAGTGFPLAPALPPGANGAGTARVAKLGARGGTLAISPQPAYGVPFSANSKSPAAALIERCARL